MYQIDGADIPAIRSLLAKSAYMFMHQHVRDGVWPSLFAEHVSMFYSGKDLRNVKTNLPRRLSQDKDWSWEAYLEALTIIARAYSKFSVDIIVSRNERLSSYTINIDKNIKMWENSEGHDIVRVDKLKTALFMPSSTNRDNESAPTHIIRNTLRLDKITLGKMDTLIETFLEDPQNTHTFSIDNPRMQKASILTTLNRGRIAWKNIPRLLKLLGYKSVSIKVTATLGTKEYSSIVGLSL
jgi:hypothetical protein